ncbi:hypothetical protein CJD36_011010 [Flavipsychrobacter stenotrophus]|uniref:Molecular chaperone Skp n=1 Tax=Flavipsychrobacter stenotrophus TaxID=2077091 RepID=A0A2S7SUV5_9BACT|nr:OmpH family outer membrane protein [Flavipsychrobacter stenotrophus]PQJ10498.1 hypothetical protein CJD36_011010 [Flavipsychrobacter stenotrophus]
MWRILIVSLITSVSITLSYSLYYSRDKKIAVVDAVKLFNEYNMKIEMEGKEKKILVLISKQMDSINNQLKIAKTINSETAIQQLSYSASEMKNDIEREYENSNKLINEQVWKRLNTSIEQFGKQKGVHLIIGANGMGTVLYNDSYYDLTSEAVKFVNREYEEGN